MLPRFRTAFSEYQNRSEIGKREVGSVRFAVVDDMQKDRDQIVSLVQDWLKAHQLKARISEFGSGEEFFRSYTPGEYDLLLLDQYMDGMTGMDMACRIREKNDSCPLVFITSSDACAVSSYEVRAAYFLLKPVTAKGIDRMMQRCMEELGSKKRSVTVISNRAPVRIRLDNILWINTEKNHLIFHTDGGLVKTYMTFENLETLLENAGQFLMCYKGCMVNMDRIAKAEEDSFLMENGDRPQIRRRGRKEIQQQYFDYLCSKAESP